MKRYPLIALMDIAHLPLPELPEESAYVRGEEIDSDFSIPGYPVPSDAITG